MNSKILNELKIKIEATNVKFLFRHSIRPSLKGINNCLLVSLTEEGINSAFEFGKNLSCNIGVASSSIAKRCIQTIEQVTKGSCSSLIYNTTEILTSPAMFDLELATQTHYAEGSFKAIAYKLSMGQILPGFYPIEVTAKKLLDYIFSIGNESGTLDLFCTHDFNIVILLLYLIPTIKSKDMIVVNWPKPLEGILIWGERYDIYFSWKGKTYHRKIKHE